jgi:hypothetical protein
MNKGKNQMELNCADMDTKIVSSQFAHDLCQVGRPARFCW